MEVITENNNKNTENTELQRFYSGTNILITGATGFLGKILLEKLLRSCPEVNTIYLLVRSKKGKHVHTRVEELLENVVFDRLRKEQPKFQHKIQAISSDCSLPGLGLNSEDRKRLQQEVNIVFHAAATVRFDEKIRLATSINIKGCKEILQLSKQMPNLRAIVHVSTAYANCPWGHIEERFYPPPALGYEKLIALTDSTDDRQLEKMTSSLLERWPNTYTLTKALAEDLVRREAEDLPVGVFRPSIVISTYKEPMRGWVDNLYGATGVCTGAGVGILRTLHCDPDSISNITPVDTTVNALICSAWDVAKRHEENQQIRNKQRRNNGKIIQQTDDEPGEIPVYNYVSTKDNSLTWSKFMWLCSLSGLKVPSVRAVWYYSLTLNKYWLVHWLYVILLHFLPGLLVDATLVCTGRKPKMLRVYKNIMKYNQVISYFCLKTWSFGYDNVISLWDKLEERDKELFFFDMRKISWKEYFEQHMLGVRLYLLKDNIKTLPQALIKWRMFYWMHQAGKVAIVFMFARFAWFVLSRIF